MSEALNVKVAVRCRPMSSKEIARGCTSIVTISDGKNCHISAIPGEKDSEQKNFTFDHAYDMDSTQSQVYKELGQPIVTQALDGFNGTIFAYGQTGSGKTHSMMGVTSQDKKQDNNEAVLDLRGIIPQLNDDLWFRLNEKLENEKLKAAKDNDGGGKEVMKCLVAVSFLEVYNEEIKDLLNPNEKKLNIRESAEKGIYVEGLMELIVRDSKDLLRLIYQGNAVRKVAATKMNDSSSRSHSVFTIKIDQRKTTVLPSGLTKELTVKAKVNLVDLAGSERASKTGAQGSTLKEGANINLSLMALGNVINALTEGTKKGGSKRVIPYRDSKLTRLLQESLGGNAATLMIAAISPADYNYSETLGTLKYANRAKSIANTVKKNEDSNEKMIRELQAQIEALKQKLETGGGDGSKQVEFIQDPDIARKMKEMEEQQRSVWEERERLSKELEEERSANVSNVISAMMQTVKDEKVTRMKNIKRLTNEKALLQKNFKETKESNGTLKSDLDSHIKQYQKLQVNYDQLGTFDEEGNPINVDPDLSEEEVGAKKKEQEDLANNMIALLTKIEEDRQTYQVKRESLKRMKDRLDKIELEMTDERAELVSSAGLLQQNDQLREQIQQEEREKLKQAFDEELALERAALQTEVVGKVQAEISLLKSQLELEEKKGKELGEKTVSLEEYTLQLEDRLADSEVQQEFMQSEQDRMQSEKDRMTAEIDQMKEENEKLKAAHKRAEDEILTVRSQALTSREEGVRELEEAKFGFFKTMMDTLSNDKKVMEEQMGQHKRLLAQAAGDVMHLLQRNEELSLALNQAIIAEPPIRD